MIQKRDHTFTVLVTAFCDPEIGPFPHFISGRIMGILYTLFSKTRKFFNATLISKTRSFFNATLISKTRLFFNATLLSKMRSLFNATLLSKTRLFFIATLLNLKINLI